MRTWMMRAALAACVGWTAAPSAARAESFEFVSKSFATTRDFARGNSAGDESIRGTLDLPSDAAMPVPAVIISHASDGVTRDVHVVARAMSAAGFATVYFDSLAARGQSSTRTGGASLGVGHQATDAFAALKKLAADGRIDQRRVAHVGMSMGGGAAVVTATESVRRRGVGSDGPRFAAHVAFYPGFHMAPAADMMTGAPILILLGERDDYQKPERPRAWIKYLKEQRADAPVELVMIAGAYHAFLTENLQPRNVADYVNGSLCPIVLLNRSGPLFLAVDGSTTTSLACEPTRGGVIGYDRDAATTALEKTAAFLRRAFQEVR